MPNYDITPALDQIFADMKYAGMEAIELMHTALLPDDAVQRIGQLSQEHQLPVLGTSYGADMWDRQQHNKILEGAEIVITRLAKLGGRTLGTSVGAAPSKKTPEQLDAQADVLRKIMALCEAHQVVLNLHNHTYEVTDDLYDLKGTLARVPECQTGSRPGLAGAGQRGSGQVPARLRRSHRLPASARSEEGQDVGGSDGRGRHGLRCDSAGA